jgi:hypothetical protein
MRRGESTRWREIKQSSAQTFQSSALQVLKDRLQRLEQEIQELKVEIDAASQAQATPVAAAAAALKTPPAPPPKNEKQSTEQERSGSTIEPYGFVMTNTGYNFGQIDPQWFDVVGPTKLPSFVNQFGGNGNAFFGVRQTRCGVKTSTPRAVDVINRYPDRFLFGTDEVARKGQEHYLRVYYQSIRRRGHWMRKQPRESAGVIKSASLMKRGRGYAAGSGTHGIAGTQNQKGPHHEAIHII